MLPSLALLLLAFLAADAIHAPAALATRSHHRPALRLAQSLPVMSADEAVEEEEVEAMSEEEYLAELASQPKEEEMSEDAARVARGMRSVTGVEFAPWMKIDAEKIAIAKKEREERKRRKSAAAAQLDQMMIDPQAAELGAGGGLKSKVISENEVELRWSTGDETGNAGFLVQRRVGGSNTFEVIDSFENFAPLKTKGAAGGEYTYLDDTVPGSGTYVYRICDQDESGSRSAICQKLVEVESASEQTQTLIIGGFIAAIALALVAAGIAADPIQTTATGRF